MKSFVLILACLLLTVPNSQLVTAHGGGVSQEEFKDGYFIDIGYQKDPLAFEQVRLDFATYPENEPQTEDVFTDVWVRIVKDKELFFSGGIAKPVFGPTGLTYAFPEEGSYEVFVRFQNGIDMVVETSLILDVLPKADDQQPLGPYSAGGVGFVIGGILTFLVFKRK